MPWVTKNLLAWVSPFPVHGEFKLQHTKNLVSKKLKRVKFPPSRESEAEVSGVSPSSEQYKIIKIWLQPLKNRYTKDILHTTSIKLKTKLRKNRRRKRTILIWNPLEVTIAVTSKFQIFHCKSCDIGMVFDFVFHDRNFLFKKLLPEGKTRFKGRINCATRKHICEKGQGEVRMRKQIIFLTHYFSFSSIFLGIRAFFFPLP